MDVKRAQDLIGSDVYDPDGTKIGRVRNVYIDDVTHQPEWVTVRAGLFGMRECFVPLAGGSLHGENRINVGVFKDSVKEAPRVEAQHGHLSDQEGRELLKHYGIQQAPAVPQQGDVPRQRAETTQEHQREVAQQRAEQQARATAENQSGGVGVRESVTAEQTTTAPVDRQEARIGGDPTSSDETRPGGQLRQDH